MLDIFLRAGIDIDAIARDDKTTILRSYSFSVLRKKYGDIKVLYKLFEKSSEKNILSGFASGIIQKEDFAVVSQFDTNGEVKRKFDSVWQTYIKTKKESEEGASIFLKELVNKKEITEADIFKLHSILMGRLRPEIIGQYRTAIVIICGRMLEAKGLDKKMKEFLEFLNQIIVNNKKSKNPYSIAKSAAIAHNKLVFIQPVGDGNKRTARAILEIILMKEGYKLENMNENDIERYGASLQALFDTNNNEPFINFIASFVEKM